MTRPREASIPSARAGAGSLGDFAARGVANPVTSPRDIRAIALRRRPTQIHRTPVGDRWAPEKSWRSAAVWAVFSPFAQRPRHVAAQPPDHTAETPTTPAGKVDIHNSLFFARNLLPRRPTLGRASSKKLLARDRLPHGARSRRIKHRRRTRTRLMQAGDAWRGSRYLSSARRAPPGRTRTRTTTVLVRTSTSR